VINNSDKQVGLYSGGLIFGGRAYIWNEVSVSRCGGLIHGGGAYIRGGGLYSEVHGMKSINNSQSSNFPLPLSWCTIIIIDNQ
jgi:hypothetical protein